jgi:hypothetical protein
MDRFIGKWKNEAGNILEIKPNDDKSLKVSFYSGRTGKSVYREYFDNKESINMNAELDFYETSLEVDLWTNEKGFQLTLLHDWMEFRNEADCYCLAPGLTQFIEDDYTDKYGDLFMPLYSYKRIEE